MDDPAILRELEPAVADAVKPSDPEAKAFAQRKLAEEAPC